MKNKKEKTAKEKIATILGVLGVVFLFPAFVLGFVGFLSGGGDIYFSEKAYNVVEITLVSGGLGALLIWVSNMME